MIIDDTIAIGVSGAAVGIVSALWLWVRATVKAQIDALRSQLDSAIVRIRELEESRLSEAKANSNAYHQASERTADAIERLADAMRAHRFPTPPVVHMPVDFQDNSGGETVHVNRKK